MSKFNYMGDWQHNILVLLFSMSFAFTNQTTSSHAARQNNFHQPKWSNKRKRRMERNTDCPPHCEQDGDCDSITRTCTHGCVPGFYGEQCDKTCSMCDGAGRCHQDTGACLQGCIPGYTGPLCAVRKVPDYNDYSGLYAFIIVVLLSALVMVAVVVARRLLSSEEMGVSQTARRLTRARLSVLENRRSRALSTTL